MPIIPLLQEPGPLPDAPPAVLDRERRPEVDLRGVQRAVGQLAQASRREPLPANQLTAPYEALGAVGRAIAETGSIVGALAKKRYEAETRTQVIEGSAAMEAEIAGFRSQLQQNPKLSPNEWNPALAQHLAGMAQRLDARQDLTADARAELGLRLRTQEKETLISTRLDADKTIFKRASDAFRGWVSDPDKALAASVVLGKVKQTMRQWVADHPQEAKDPVKVREALKNALPEGARLRSMAILMDQVRAAAAPAPQATFTEVGAVSDALVAAVKGWESFSSSAYSDYKQYSVGYGTRARSPREVLTEPEAERRLRAELAMHAGRIDGAARRVGVKLSPGQRDALISFDFNTGSGSELIADTGGDTDEIRRRMRLYVKAGGETLAGLVTRRERESVLFDSLVRRR